MEDLLLNIVKEATGAKLNAIKQSSQEAYGKAYNKFCGTIRKTHAYLYFYIFFVFPDLLCSQHSLLRSPSHELRTACFTPLRLSLESKRSKLVTLALSGFNVSISICFCLYSISP